MIIDSNHDNLLDEAARNRPSELSRSIAAGLGCLHRTTENTAESMTFIVPCTSGYRSKGVTFISPPQEFSPVKAFPRFQIPPPSLYPAPIRCRPAMTTIAYIPIRSLFCTLVLWTAVGNTQPANSTLRHFPERVESALSRAGTNGAELVRFLEKTPESQKDASQFLLANMPQPDLQSLSAAFLLKISLSPMKR